MAQTERSYTDVQTILPNNAASEVSPQDLRDAFASGMGYGGMILSIAGAPVNINSVGTTYVLVDIFNVITAQSSDVNVGGTVVALTPTWDITFTTTGIYKVEFWASFSSSQNNHLVTFAPHVAGSIGLVEVDRWLATGSDTGVVSMGAVIPYTAGDTLDIRVKTDSDAPTSNLTFLAGGLSAFRVG